MNIARCPRCGKEIQLTQKTANKKIRCPHCNCIMKQDKKTDKKLLFAKIAYAFTFIVIVSFIYSFFNSQITDTISIVVIIFAGIVSAGTSDVVAKWIVFRFFGFSYEKE